MGLKEIADAALGEVAEEDRKSGSGGGGGTESVTFSFSLDPSVVAEMSRAMEKGTEREDLSDEISSHEDEGDDDDDDADPYNGVDTGDEAIPATFAEALDMIDGVAEDARANSRHAQTPLENCRAKDPRFCPYHGIPAWKKHLEDSLKSAGVGGCTVDVQGANGKYTVRISGYGSQDRGLVDAVVSGMLATNGVVPAGKSASAEQGVNETAGSFASKFGMTDLTGRLNEWVDDYLADVAADPNAEVDLDDLSALLEAQEDLEDFERKMDPNDSRDADKFRGMVKAAEDMYHSLVAQQYFKGVKTLHEGNFEYCRIHSDYAKQYVDAYAKKNEVDAAKKQLFGGRGAFPAGFSAAHPFSDKYTKAVQKLFQRAVKDMDESEHRAAVALKAADIKGCRTALAAMDYHKDNFANGVPAYERAKDEFMRELYRWAVSDPKYSANVPKAFPNGQPK